MHSRPETQSAAHCAVFTLLLSVLPFFLAGQSTPVYYEPLPLYPVNLDSVLQKYNETYAAMYRSYEGEYRNETKEIYNGRLENIRRELTDGDFYFHPAINTYFQNILAEIVRGNPELAAQNLRLFVSRYEYPNAFCRGDGTLVFNLSLLRHLDNESQIAFIIAHEIAHQTADHVNAAINKRTNYIYSKETKKQLKKIRKDPYNKYTNTVNLYKEYIFDDRRHSRLHEAEADAQALNYLQNTKYNLAAAAETLQILDTVDEAPAEPLFDIRTVFNSPAFPFQDAWLQKEETVGFFMGSGDGDNDEILPKDSLKTHPDCQKRITLLADKLPPFDTSATRKIVYTEDFAEIYAYSQYEQVVNFNYYGQTGKALYATLALLDDFPEDAWLYTQVSRNLLELTEAQENHRLSDILDFPRKRQPEHYHDFLTFIRNLRLRELALLNRHFTLKYKEKFSTYTPLQDLAKEVEAAAARLK